MPGAETPPIRLPPVVDATDASEAGRKRREEAIRKLYPTTRPTPTVADAAPETAEIGLDALQDLSRDNNPRVRAAAAAVESARGAVIQAGLPPNPEVGYQADTVRTAFTNGYHGAYIQQTLITARKLGLAATAAAVDYANASLELRKTWYQVCSEVRRQYFNLLAARKRLELAQGLLELSERAYETQVKLVQGGEAAPYEPLQSRVLATQARALVIQAQQDAVAAWRVLIATVGLPALPAEKIAGRIDCAVPVIDYETALARMLASHTDVLTAQNLVQKSRTLVTLADRTPIPDLNVYFALQRDYTFNPGTTTYNLQLGGPIPVFDRNQGGRVSSRADLVQASQNVSTVQNDLTASLAPVFANYEANRQLAASFRTDALQDQVRAYRGVYQRYYSDPEGIGFNDVIVAQQILAATLNQYVGILQSQWGALVDLGELLQVNDIFQLGPAVEVAQFPTPIMEGDVEVEVPAQP